MLQLRCQQSPSWSWPRRIFEAQPRPNRAAKFKRKCKASIQPTAALQRLNAPDRSGNPDMSITMARRRRVLVLPSGERATGSGSSACIYTGAQPALLRPRQQLSPPAMAFAGFSPQSLRGGAGESVLALHTLRDGTGGERRERLMRWLRAHSLAVKPTLPNRVWDPRSVSPLRNGTPDRTVWPARGVGVPPGGERFPLELLRGKLSCGR